MKLGLQLGYWGAQPPDNHAELVAAAEEAGFDTVFTAEAWGSDAYTPLAWWGRETKRMRLGTAGVQAGARARAGGGGGARPRAGGGVAPQDRGEGPRLVGHPAARAAPDGLRDGRADPR